MSQERASSAYFVPVFNVETEVHVEVLVVVVVEDAVRLPWLPPVRLESDAGMVDDAVIVNVRHQRAYGHCSIREARVNQL